MALINKLEAIGDAIREKTGTSDLLTLDQMATAISGITGGGEVDIPEEAFVISGNCAYKFANGGWDWFIENYGDKITTEGITGANNMFSNSKINVLPFDINFVNGGCSCNYMFSGAKLENIPSLDFKQTSYKETSNMFNNCNDVKEIGTLKNLYPSKMDGLFQYCYNLKNVPEFENLNLDRVYTYASAGLQNMFFHCHSLREIPEELLNKLYTPKATSYIYPFLYSAFNGCYALDEIKGVNPQTSTITSNLFSTTFTTCSRVKDITFALQEDGTPYTVNWKTQTIDLSSYVGFVSSKQWILDYNSGITADKQVTDEASYEALKNDPDWFTALTSFSRYNHDSAVNTINSLPDTSAYLVTAGGTNTIKFKGNAGSLTDGGAINTLTEEEIAVAAAKGWTVTFA